MKDTITTYSKIQFSPINPNPNHIHIRDIAHALSFMTRANGHFKSFYSVAQHCIGCCYEAKAKGYSKKVQLACLLHDASEAYLSDITRPVKKHLPAYIDIEKKLQDAIYGKFLTEPLTQEEKIQVGSVDDAMLSVEFLYFMEEKLFETDPEVKHKPDFSFHEFAVIENLYVKLLQELTE